MVRSSLQNQRGQVVIEYILLIVVMVGVLQLMKGWFIEKKFIQSFTLQPWERLNGMVQCGTWQKCGVESPAPGIHPNTRARVLSLDPET